MRSHLFEFSYFKFQVDVDGATTNSFLVGNLQEDILYSITISPIVDNWQYPQSEPVYARTLTGTRKHPSPGLGLTLKVPEKLQLYGLYVYYVVHICDFGMLRVNSWACSQRSESRTESCFRSRFWSTLSWFESLILPLVNAKLFQIRLLICKKLDCDLPRKPDSEDLWMQSTFRMWFAPLWKGPVKGSISAVGTKYYLASPVCDRTVVAMLVNACSSNHKPNQQADHESDSLLC